MLILVQRNQRQIVIYSYRLQLVKKNSEVSCLRQQKCQWQQSNTTTLLKVRILDKHVGLISIYKQGDGLIFISTRSRLQQYQCRLKNHAITHPVLFLSDKCKTVCYNRAKRSSVLIYSISTIICVLIICFVRIIWICRY